MSRPATPAAGKCPHESEREICNLQCKYNHFEADELQIDSWELKCLDCGFRETIAYRSDEPETLDECDNPTVCPFCDQGGLCPGRNPCEQ